MTSCVGLLFPHFVPSFCPFLLFASFSVFIFRTIGGLATSPSPEGSIFTVAASPVPLRNSGLYSACLKLDK